MTKQDIINEVLIHTDDELCNRNTNARLRAMYIELTQDYEHRSLEVVLCRLRDFVNKTIPHKGIEHNLYAVHTLETDTFRIFHKCNELYDVQVKYPSSVVKAAYRQLIPDGIASMEEEKISEMIEFLHKHDAPAVYEQED